MCFGGTQQLEITFGQDRCWGNIESGSTVQLAPGAWKPEIVLAPTFCNQQDPVMTMRTFMEFWKGMFFFVSTLTVPVIFYLVVVKWQPLWTAGFKDFGDISAAIMHLDKTAKPVAEMAPLMRARRPGAPLP